MINSTIKFVNHASVIISNKDTSILSDPWFFGDAFHRGWNLLHETPRGEIEDILDQITHIWISHEHPDHFSVPFFKTYAEKIRNNKIQILFQENRDKRVLGFLRSMISDVRELRGNQKTEISKGFSVTCIKDGFYDSALLVENGDEKILNLNDCDIVTDARARELYKLTGRVDVLLTQFSYAAWKGGKANKAWRERAAREKIKTIELQQKTFLPKFIIPFASFIYFSNNQNKYLNDWANRPSDVVECLASSESQIIVLKPNDYFGGDHPPIKMDESLSFWKEKYETIPSREFHNFDKVSLTELKDSFNVYCDRIRSQNNLFFIKILRTISPIKVFKPVIIRLEDLNSTVEFDYVSRRLVTSDGQPLMSMQSESLDFIFRNSFGFDTLTVNGCFEEEAKGGFLLATRTLAIENLNNLGVSVSLLSIFRLDLIKTFAARLLKVARNMR